MAEAIFGLVGVLIGSLLSVVTNIFLANRNDKISAKVGARLVRDDLHTVAIYLENAIVNKEWVDKNILHINIKMWDEHRASLAKVLKYSTYSEIVTSIIAVGKINGWLDNYQSDQKIDDSTTELMKNWLNDIRIGLQALLSVAGDKQTS